MPVLDTDQKPVSQLVVGQVVLVPNLFGGYAMVPVVRLGLDGKSATAEGQYNLYGLILEEDEWHCNAIGNKAAIQKIRF